jgi:hypothetical protein
MNMVCIGQNLSAQSNVKNMGNWVKKGTTDTTQSNRITFYFITRRACKIFNMYSINFPIPEQEGIAEKPSSLINNPTLKPVPFLELHGNISYIYDYRSQLDMPFVAPNLQQHNEQMYINLLNIFIQMPQMYKLLLSIFIAMLLLNANVWAQNIDSTLNNLLGSSTKSADNVNKKKAGYSNTIAIKTGQTLAKIKRIESADSSLDNLLQVPIKYINQVDKKIEEYSDRIINKTEKTLTKLSRWENKIRAILEEANPETAQRLFGNNQLTFTKLLQQLKDGEAIVLQYKAPYNKYRDEVTTSLKYLAQQKEQLNSSVIKKVEAATNKMQELASEEDRIEAMKQFIKERKKQLIEQAFQQIGNSKYLTKINKETYYYIETLKNYKELFSDSKKAEETALAILNKIPAFQKFMQKNSQLASLFGVPGGGSGASNMASVSGLQTRASIQTLLQDRMASGGPNAQEAFSQGIQQAQDELAKLKDKVLSSAGVGGSEGGELPDFKPNMQKTKTFKQRLDYGLNFQFAKSNTLIPATTNIGLSIGYKLNDKSVIGLGAGYILGMGTIQHIQLTHQGINLRSYMDWKLKKQFFISGGYEMNHNAQFENFAQLQSYDAWQRSALIGITKKISIKSKWFKSTNIQVLYDFLYNQHLPASQPFVFRFGYGFKN